MCCSFVVVEFRCMHVCNRAGRHASVFLPDFLAYTIVSYRPLTVATPTISLEEALAISKKARVIKFGNLPDDPDLHKGMHAFINELFKALKYNTVGGDSCMEVTVDTEEKTAMVEFRTVKEAAMAKEGLNGVEYGGNKMSVAVPEGYAPLTGEESTRCLGNGVLGTDNDAPPKGSTAAAAVAAATAAAAAAGGQMEAPQPSEAHKTEVVVLSNIMSDADLADAQECADILDDTKCKCAEYGEVLAALVVKPGEGGDAGQQYGKKTLVKFADADKAFSAAKALHGLKFDGRPVATSVSGRVALLAAGRCPRPCPVCAVCCMLLLRVATLLRMLTYGVPTQFAPVSVFDSLSTSVSTKM